MDYDSRPDTYEHIHRVQLLLFRCLEELAWRTMTHDETKLLEPEKSVYDQFTPKLIELKYWSKEYRQCLKEMGPALQHHYQYNQHHPEHYPNGINGMNLLDLLEMLADWKAASIRHAGGNIQDSLDINRKRFGISDQLFDVIKNTVDLLHW